MSDPREIINRCTRAGVTSWQSVAKQMGISVDAVRNRYDPSYLRARPWPHPCESVTPDGEPEPIDENDMSSPYPKGPGLKALILALLQAGPASAETIANRLQSTSASIRVRLSQLRNSGLVENDSGGRICGAIEWTWRLTERGREAGVTRYEVGAKEGA